MIKVTRPKEIKTLHFIGFFGLIIGCMYQCFSFFTIYFTYPSTVEITVINKAILEFPAVTVCNSNPVRYSVWCREDMELCRKRPNEKFKSYKDRMDDHYNRLSKERRIHLGYSLEQFVILAEYEEVPVLDKFQWFYDYEYTNCYTFNGAWGNNGPLERAMVFNPATGKFSELILCFNMDVTNYNNFTGKVVAKAQMTIHANDVIPNPTYDSASLKAGTFYSYEIKKVTTLLLKPPFQSRCRSYENEREFRTGARMSQKNCLSECFKTETEAKCNCTYRRLSLLYDATPCETDDCLKNEERRVSEVCDYKCPMACRKTEFHLVATHSEPLREESPLYQSMNIRKLFPTQEKMNENMACMSIRYGSTEARTLAQNPKYNFIESFSVVGGYSGLWLGFSFLNIHNVVISRITDYFKKRMYKRQRKRNMLFRKRLH